MMQIAPTRPILRYHGGKWRTAPWILSHFPNHRVYVEPFGGAASTLMQKKRSYAEIYNDLDGEIVNVFQVLRDEATARELERLLCLTPFAREEFAAAFTPSQDPIEQARRTILKSFAGHGSDSIHRGKASDSSMFTRVVQWKAHTGFRSDSNRSGTTPAKDWASYPVQIARFCSRLQGVVIERRAAIKVIEQYDYPDALIYADPPYVRSTRRDLRHGYRYEMTEEDHRHLAEVLQSVRGMVIISGYACDLYDHELYPGWRRYKRSTRVFGNGVSPEEVLWISPNTPERHPELFRGKDA